MTSALSLLIIVIAFYLMVRAENNNSKYKQYQLYLESYQNVNCGTGLHPDRYVCVLGFLCPHTDKLWYRENIAVFNHAIKELELILPYAEKHLRTLTPEMCEYTPLRKAVWNSRKILNREQTYVIA